MTLLRIYVELVLTIGYLYYNICTFINCNAHSMYSRL